MLRKLLTHLNIVHLSNELRAGGYHHAADIIVAMLHSELDRYGKQADQFATTCSLLGVEDHGHSDDLIGEELRRIRELLNAKPGERILTLIARYKAKAEAGTLFGVVYGGES